ncbi:MAG TPA: GNAT family N-acetyltransferase [Thermomicrobiales bacterium]|nr:GNAT family N-acetyltransferase [Thermomicrobiales bacterium]
MTITIRAATLDDAASIARVHVASWRTTYRGLVPDGLLDRLAVAPRERYWGGIIANPDAPEFIYVAQSPDGEIIGFVSGGPEQQGSSEYTGELYAIYLLEDWQRQGIGRRLTREVARELLARGHSSMLLWVFAGSTFRRFYERLGGIVVAEKEETFGGATLLVVAYGWSDLQRLYDILITAT